MRKLFVTEFITLDGVIEDPGGADKSEHGGWSRAYWNDEIGKYKIAELNGSDAFLLGRVTYQGFARVWPSMKDEFANRMNSLPHFVVSKTLKELTWNNSTQIKENVGLEVSKLKQQPGGDIMIAGSGTLVRSLMKDKLIDEVRLLVYPVVLGTGKQLFRDGDYAALKLIESKNLGGVMALTYQSADNSGAAKS